MQIELPAPSWSDALRIHDDAHTLTLPAQDAAGLVDRPVAAAEAGPALHCAVDTTAAPTLTLTLTA
jgi:hypothetical protein